MANGSSRDALLTRIVWTIRAFYVLSSLAILTVRLIPAFAQRFLAYGARATIEQRRGSHIDEKFAKQNQPSSVGIKLLDYLATFNVPHSWFTHFYILSLVCSFTTLTTLYYFPWYYEETIKRNTNIEVAAFCAHLMLLQSLRRLFECIFVHRSSTSRMWIGHYAIGMAFYLATNLAIWIEQLTFAPTIPGVKERSTLWTWRTILCTLLFLTASIKQNKYHRYLASLQKYTLPSEHAFRYVIAPHYTMECVIYLSMAILDAPVAFDGRRQASTSVNWTMFCAFVFVVVNLQVTAVGTREWQLSRFQDRRYEIRQRRAMFPWFYQS